MFIGTRQSTRILALIAVNEPVLPGTLIRALGLHRGAAYEKMSGLRGIGVVARFWHPIEKRQSPPRRRAPKLVMIDPAFRADGSLRLLLLRLAQIAGDIALPRRDAEPAGPRVDQAVEDASVDRIFGHPKRTLAIVVAHALGPVDQSTLGSMIGCEHGDVYTILDPLVRSGILVSHRDRGLVAYEMNRDVPWWTELGAFLDDLVFRAYPRLGAKAEVADVMRRSKPHRTKLAPPRTPRPLE